MQLLVDTGATVSLVTKEDFKKFFDQKYQLSKTLVQLQNFSKQCIEMVVFKWMFDTKELLLGLNAI